MVTQLREESLPTRVHVPEAAFNRPYCANAFFQSEGLVPGVIAGSSPRV